ncbi:MAG TPA: ABC transporter substrate-binding protein [Dehalococcoidia bacterium]|nr:ABC transporter substrate-binding protein [Dehalococcoidia bacterium]
MSAGGRWFLLGLLALGATLLVAFSLYAVRPVGSLQPAYGGRYVEALVGAPARVNPLFVGFNDADRDLASLVFSGLTRVGEDGMPLPDLAESWQVSPDGRTYTFHLRQGVLWHDGAPFTADDVLLTWDAVRSRSFRGEPTMAEFWRSLGFAKVDDYSIAVTLAQPYAPFLAEAALGILPRHRLAGVSGDELWDSPFNRSPVGTGPFRLRQLTPERALLEANPSYHLGRPYLAEIEFRFYPDETAAVASLKRGETRGLLLGSGTDPKALEGIKGMERLSAPAASYTLVYLNAGYSPFQDQRVRQALLYALDKDRLIRNALEGQGVRAEGPIAPGTWANDGSMSPYKYDLAKVTALLQEAGWRRSGTGPWEKGGQTLSFKLMTNDNPQREAVGREVVRQWREAGIDVELTVLPSLTLVREFLTPRSYQAALFGWGPGPDPDPYAAWHSSQKDSTGSNLAAYSNAEMDDILVKARQTTDPLGRRRLYRDFQLLFAAQLPSLPLYRAEYSYLIPQEMGGVSVGVLFWPASRFDQVHRWYIKTTRG